MIEPTIPKEGTRKRRVLDVFLKLDGAWITSQRLDREYGFTQIHARMKELKEAPYYWPIERSKTTNEHGFYSYRSCRKCGHSQCYDKPCVRGRTATHMACTLQRRDRAIVQEVVHRTLTGEGYVKRISAFRTAACVSLRTSGSTGARFDDATRRLVQ